MNGSIVPFLVGVVEDRLRLAVGARLDSGEGGEYCEITPLDIEKDNGFTVRFRVTRQNAEAIFVPYTYAADLIEAMGRATPQGRLAFTALARGLRERGLKLFMNVNGKEVDPADAGTWPEGWQRLEMSLARRMPMFAEEGEKPQHETLAAELVVPVLALAVALLGVEDATDEPESPVTVGQAEGRPYQTLVTRYERKGVNREACIQLKGCWCHACGFDFERFYGPLGAGYIEVHHIVMASRMGAGYMVDPAKDLVPLCANCHAMVHRQNPPLPVEELARLAGKRQATEPANGDESTS